MRIRDAVSGDIILNNLEEYCIRQPAFQRLHRIKQLGNTFHIYPSAMHTRFEHSLGVSQQVKKLLAQPKFFPHGYKIRRYKKKLIELAGLLHDIVHTPFKHTLDRDAAVLPEPKMKLEYRYRFEELNLDKKLKEDDIELLLDILATKNAYTLSEPYLRQIIEDTISADLLDYSRRDAYFTIGWGMQWDERIYDHIAISYYNNKPFLVTKLTDRKGRITPSAITEINNLLQIRYMLNERVYFYPTKIAVDSLLIKSIRCLIQNSDKKPKQLREIFRNMSDEELINHLVSSNIPETKLYAERLKGRVLPGLAHSFKSHELLPAEKENIANHCRGCDTLEQWKHHEEEIEKEAHVKSGSVIIYCHEVEMQKKEPDFLVQNNRDEEPQPVVSNHEMKDEISAIGNKHRNLWRCYIFSLTRSSKALERIKSAAISVLKNIKNVK